MRVWVDLTNSPHPLLFEPVVAALRKNGAEVLVTARQFAQTAELARQRFPDVQVIGGGSPTSVPKKFSTLGARVRRLIPIARAFKPDVCVSHGAYDQIVTARLLNLRSLVSVDYEYQPANHLSFRLASRVLLPEAMDETDIRRRGATRRRTWRYRGLKEELYLRDFVPSDRVREELIGGHDGPVLTLRPPPEGALYHRDTNPLFAALVEKLKSDPQLLTLVVPRHPHQAAELQAQFTAENVRILDRVVDGPQLVWWSDALVSGGGTMNREAVVLGTPVWTIFASRLGAVDRQLVAAGRLHQLRALGDLDQFLPERRVRRSGLAEDHQVLEQFCDAIRRTARV